MQTVTSRRVGVQEEARRHGVDVSDFQKVNALVKEQGGLGALLAMPDTDRAAGHPAQQVPRFGSDLGFSQRGIQVRAPLRLLRTVACIPLMHTMCSVSTVFGLPAAVSLAGRMSITSPGMLPCWLVHRAGGRADGSVLSDANDRGGSGGADREEDLAPDPAGRPE